jgi:hypothetical protein
VKKLHRGFFCFFHFSKKSFKSYADEVFGHALHNSAKHPWRRFFQRVKKLCRKSGQDRLFFCCFQLKLGIADDVYRRV